MEDSIDGLWNLTYSESGINKEFFDNYFEGSAKACAYKLGKIKKYMHLISLEVLVLIIRYNPLSI